MNSNRRGFTLVEVLIVLIMIGIIASITVGGLTRSRQRAQSGMAQRYLATYAASARAEAMQRGYPATLRIAGDSVWVTADSSGNILVVRRAVRLSNDFAVTTATTASAVSFDARGFASGLPPEGARVVIQPRNSGPVRDTVCFTRAGLVKLRGCA